MKTAFRELHQWVKANPLKACLFSALTGILATWDGTRPYLVWTDLIPWVAFWIIINAVCMFGWLRKLFLFAMIFSFLCPTQSKAAEKPQSAGIAAAVVVVVVGGVVIFKVVQFCQNHFPRNEMPPTNAPSSLEYTDFYAASMTYSAMGNCYVPQTNSLLAMETPATVFEFSGGFIDTGDGFEFRMVPTRKAVESSGSVDLMEFNSELVPWGIHLGSGGESFFGLNGSPCAPEDIPITFSQSSEEPVVDVAVGDWVRTVVFEKSGDLKEWKPMLTMTISAEQQVRFSDAGTSATMFYRCRPL